MRGCFKITPISKISTWHTSINHSCCSFSSFSDWDPKIEDEIDSEHHLIIDLNKNDTWSQTSLMAGQGSLTMEPDWENKTLFSWAGEQQECADRFPCVFLHLQEILLHQCRYQLWPSQHIYSPQSRLPTHRRLLFIPSFYTTALAFPLGQRSEVINHWLSL